MNEKRRYGFIACGNTISDSRSAESPIWPAMPSNKLLRRNRALTGWRASSRLPRALSTYYERRHRLIAENKAAGRFKVSPQSPRPSPDIDHGLLIQPSPLVGITRQRIAVAISSYRRRVREPTRRAVGPHRARREAAIMPPIINDGGFSARDIVTQSAHRCPAKS